MSATGSTCQSILTRLDGECSPSTGCGQSFAIWSNSSQLRHFMRRASVQSAALWPDWPQFLHAFLSLRGLGPKSSCMGQ